MPLVFTAITPNAPELAAEVAGDSGELSAIAKAMKELEGELYFMKPDTILLLTEHGAEVPELINATISGRMKSESGELAVTGDVELTTHLKGAIDTERHDVPMTIVAPSTLPPEVVSPFTFLLDHLEECKVVVISTAKLGLDVHVEFGRFLHHELLQSNKRIAVIAAGHFGAAEAAADGRSFAALALKALEENRPAEILSFNESILSATQSDLVRPLAVMVGVLDTLNVAPTIVATELAYGSVNSVINFVIQ